MNIQEETKNIKNDVDVALLHSEELNSVEKIMNLAVYELAAATEKYNNSHIERIVLQGLAVDIRKLLDKAPKTESLVQTEKNFSRLENIILKLTVNHKEK